MQTTILPDSRAYIAEKPAQPKINSMRLELTHGRHSAAARLMRLVVALCITCALVLLISAVTQGSALQGVAACMVLVENLLLLVAGTSVSHPRA